MYQLKVKEKNLSFNITDVGFGLSQILPIITECINYSLKARYKKSRLQDQMYHYGSRNEDVNKILIIEQPEIHLNPRIQAELGDFFIKVSKSDRALLIELTLSTSLADSKKSAEEHWTQRMLLFISFKTR